MNIIDAIKGRFSARQFLDELVDPSIIESILDAARWAPSGVDAQPWRVAVLMGQSKKNLSEALIDARHAGVAQQPDYNYYADEWFEPYKSRRKACGIALYKAMGIKRDDLPMRKKVWGHNYHFFFAPVGLIFYVDKRLATGSWMDVAMFMQNVMLAAMEYGLGTCPQAALAEYPDIIRSQLGLSDQFSIICGMSLGYPDKKAAVNQYRTARESVSAFTTWFD